MIWRPWEYQLVPWVHQTPFETLQEKSEKEEEEEEEAEEEEEEEEEAAWMNELKCWNMVNEEEDTICENEVIHGGRWWVMEGGR